MEEKNKLNQGIMYFIINRCSFSGATLSGGFSKEASKKIPTKNLTYISKNNNVIDYKKNIEKIIKDYYSGKLNLRLINAMNIAIKNYSEKQIVNSTIKIYKTLEKEKNESYLLNKDKYKFNDWLAQ